MTIAAPVPAEMERDAAIRQRIEGILNRARPLLRADGIDLALVDVTHQSATIRVTGDAAGCDALSVTFHPELEALLRNEITAFRELHLLIQTR